MYLMCAQNVCKKKGKGNATTKVKKKRLLRQNRKRLGCNQTKPRKARAWCGCGARRRGSGKPPRATPGVLLHNRLDWQGLDLGVSE